VPTDTSDKRKYPYSGFWLFLCNTSFWNADAWLARGEQDLLYKVSKNDGADMCPGQLGLLRLNKDRRSLQKRGGRPATEVGIYAVFEVVELAIWRSDPDERDYNSPKDAKKEGWRVRLRIIANLLNNPILEASLPDRDDFQIIRRPFQASSVPLTESAFKYLHGLADTRVKIQADTIDGVALLERQAVKGTPEFKQKISRFIERGAVSRDVKREREGKCQICESLGREGVAFLDRNGEPYSEAHHVIPVSTLKPGTLGHLNIMVLCANHHRHAHFGKFELKDDRLSSWLIEIDSTELEIAKTVLKLNSRERPRLSQIR
jgi:hypothetical protein